MSNIYTGEKTVLGKQRVGIHTESDETRSVSPTPHKINSKEIKDLHARPKTLELPNRKRLQDTGIIKDFLNKSLVIQEIMPTLDKRDPMKQKYFCSAKESVN